MGRATLGNIFAGGNEYFMNMSLYFRYIANASLDINTWSAFLSFCENEIYFDVSLYNSSPACSDRLWGMKYIPTFQYCL